MNLRTENKFQPAEAAERLSEVVQFKTWTRNGKFIDDNCTYITIKQIILAILAILVGDDRTRNIVDVAVCRLSRAAHATTAFSSSLGGEHSIYTAFIEYFFLERFAKVSNYFESASIDGLSSRSTVYLLTYLYSLFHSRFHRWSRNNSGWMCFNLASPRGADERISDRHGKVLEYDMHSSVLVVLAVLSAEANYNLDYSSQDGWADIHTHACRTDRYTGMTGIIRASMGNSQICAGLADTLRTDRKTQWTSTPTPDGLNEKNGYTRDRQNSARQAENITEHATCGNAMR